jgi:hypothetical protein
LCASFSPFIAALFAIMRPAMTLLSGAQRPTVREALCKAQELLAKFQAKKALIGLTNHRSGPKNRILITNDLKKRIKKKKTLNVQYHSEYRYQVQLVPLDPRTTRSR